MHLLVPMSGQGTRYQQKGYDQPKPLIPVSGKPMIARLLENFPASWPCTFVLAENHRATELPGLLSKHRPGAEIVFVPPHKKGPGLAIEAALPSIPRNRPVFVSYCDYGMVWDAAQFERFVRQTVCDACLVSYRGFHAHYLSPVTYGFSRLDGERVVEVREKGSFTADRENEFASSGGYYFRSAHILGAALAEQKARGLELNGELYTTLTVEALLRADPRAHVRVFEIDRFFQWGTPEDLESFQYWEHTFSAWNRCVADRGTVAQVLMPMAGAGSRFSTLTDTPKPFINVAGRPMYTGALDSLPRAENTALVCLEEHRPFVERTLPTYGVKTRWLPTTPEGQALSTDAGIDLLDEDREVLVSSCDHEIVCPAAVWNDFHNEPDCDAAIFTIRGFPGTDRRPLSYAYVVPNGDGPFPEVARVSVKMPVSERPSRDALLVGTFWFRSARLLREGIRLLRAKDLRVNGELYLDSVFECLLEAGHRIRAVPLEGYICRGDPDALAESTYYQEIFGGCRRGIRRRNAEIGSQARI